MNDLLQQGITAYKAGNRDEARKIFITVVKQSPESERGWGWMYDTSENDKERIYCLKQMLRINPKNEKANQLLIPLLTPILQSPIQADSLGTSTKKCPHCAEIIQAEAVVCRYCGRSLVVTNSSPQENISNQTTKVQPPKQKKNNCLVTVLVIIGIISSVLCFFFFVLPVLGGSDNTSGGDTSAWVPSGFKQWDNETAFRFVDGIACSYSTGKCSHVEVFTRRGCPNSLYVEVAFKDGNGTQIDWGNDTATSLSLGTKAMLEFVSFNNSATKTTITQIKCY